MSVDIFPAGIISQGNNTWTCTATSPLNAAKDKILLTALNAASAVDLTCYMPAAEQEIGFDQDRDDDTRGCDSNKREDFGTASFTRDEIIHIVHPQGDPTDPGNLAVGALPANTIVYLSLRMGIKHGTAHTAGDKYDVYEVQTGEEHITPRESGKYRRQVKTSFTRIAHAVEAIAGP